MNALIELSLVCLNFELHITYLLSKTKKKKQLDRIKIFKLVMSLFDNKDNSILNILIVRDNSRRERPLMVVMKQTTLCTVRSM